MRKLNKILFVMLSPILAFCVFTACVDYVYEYHFSVVGENGTINVAYPDGKPYLEALSPYNLLGGKNRGLSFIATPDEGYQVKEWTLNGEMIEGEKSNLLHIEVVYTQNPIAVTVEFEIIP